jgi:hypothetical protein
MRLKPVALLCTLISLCLPAAARANATRSSFAHVEGGLSFSVRIAHGIVGNSGNLRDAEMGGPFSTEQSTGLLLLIGFGLIAGASLIGGKIGRSDSVEEVEHSGETAILSRPTRRFYGTRTPTMAGIPTTSKTGAAMELMQNYNLRRLSSK